MSLKFLNILGFCLLSLTATNSHADGFICESATENLQIEVYNHLDKNIGTRTVAVMVVADPSLPRGQQTVARFTHAKNRLTNTGADYSADMDATNEVEMSHFIGSVRLRQIESVRLDVDFSYAQPVEAGEILAADFWVNQRNGQQSRFALNCFRYLKGE